MRGSVQPAAGHTNGGRIHAYHCPRAVVRGCRANHLTEGYSGIPPLQACIWGASRGGGGGHKGRVGLQVSASRLTHLLVCCGTWLCVVKAPLGNGHHHQNPSALVPIVKVQTTTVLGSSWELVTVIMLRHLTTPNLHLRPGRARAIHRQMNSVAGLQNKTQTPDVSRSCSSRIIAAARYPCHSPHLQACWCPWTALIQRSTLVIVCCHLLPPLLPLSCCPDLLPIWILGSGTASVFTIDNVCTIGSELPSRFERRYLQPRLHLQSVLLRIVKGAAVCPFRPAPKGPRRTATVNNEWDASLERPAWFLEERVHPHVCGTLSRQLQGTVCKCHQHTMLYDCTCQGI